MACSDSAIEQGHQSTPYWMMMMSSHQTEDNHIIIDQSNHRQITDSQLTISFCCIYMYIHVIHLLNYSFVTEYYVHFCEYFQYVEWESDLLC